MLLKYSSKFLFAIVFTTIFGSITAKTIRNITFLGVDDGLPERNVVSISYSPDSLTWIGFSSKICVYDGSHFFDLNNFLDTDTKITGRDFYSLHHNRASYVVSTDGIFELYPSRKIKGKLSNKQIYSFKNKSILFFHSNNKNTIFFWEKDKIYCLNIAEKKLTVKHFSKSYKIFKGLDNQIYISNSKKLFRFSDSGLLEQIHANYQFDLLPKSSFDSYLVDGIYHNDNVIDKINNSLSLIIKKLEKQLIDFEELYTHKVGEISSYLLMSNGDYWFATPYGIIKYHLGNDFVDHFPKTMNTRGIYYDSLTKRTFIAYYNGVIIYDSLKNVILDKFSKNGWFRELILCKDKLICVPEGALSYFWIIDTKKLDVDSLPSHFMKQNNTAAYESDSTILTFSDSIFRFYPFSNKRGFICVNKIRPSFRSYQLSDSTYCVIGLSEVNIFNKNTLSNRKIIDGKFVSAAFIRKELYLLSLDGEVLKFNKDFLKQSKIFSLKNFASTSYELTYHKATNSLWIGSNNGLFGINLSTNRLVKVFNKSHGFLSNEFNSFSSFVSGNKIFFGGLSGVNYFNLNFNQELNHNKAPSVLEIPDGNNSSDYYLFSFLPLKLSLENKRNGFKLYFKDYFPGNNVISSVLDFNNKRIQIPASEALEIRNVNSGKHKLNLLYESFGKSIPINFEFYVNYPWYFQFWALAIWFSIIAFIFYFSLSYRAKLLENKYLAITETRRQQLYQIIAHDLKSPLNHFSDLLNIVKFLIQKNRFEDLKTVTDDLNKSAQSIDLILSNLLGLTHSDYLENKTEVVNLKELFLVICEPYKLIAEAKNLIFDFEYDGLNYFVTNKMAISILARNLIDNAVKHGRKSVRIEVKVNSAGSKFLMIVSNDFDNKHLYSLSLIEELISKNKQIETGEVGTGLGLVLISKSIHLIGGKISVRKSESYLVMKVLLTDTPNSLLNKPHKHLK